MMGQVQCPAAPFELLLISDSVLRENETAPALCARLIVYGTLSNQMKIHHLFHCWQRKMVCVTSAEAFNLPPDARELQNFTNI